MRERTQETSLPNRVADDVHRREIFDVLGGFSVWLSAIVILALIASGSLVVLAHDARRSAPDAFSSGQSGERCVDLPAKSSGPQALLRQRAR